jgi:hypothetical protein
MTGIYHLPPERDEFSVLPEKKLALPLQICMFHEISLTQKVS